MINKFINQVIVICGPTASGKSNLAVKLAKNIDAEIISADSMQIYRKLDIGTAKVSKEIQAEISHHMIDIIEPDQPFSVAEYSKLATSIINKLLANKKNVILCGGTGQYINALLDGLIFIDLPVDKELRKSLNQTITKDNSAAWYNKLNNLDPKYGQRISGNDLRRIRRFFEVYQLSGLTQSEIYIKSRAKGPDFKFINFYLKPEREALYNKINLRTEMMFEQGLSREVESLLQSYPEIRDSQSFQAIGYKETVAFLDGKIDLSKAIQNIAQVTRNYAKRQMTWFNARKDLQVIQNFGNQETLENILAHF
ncbi:MAG: tRNA (adenosine(37)-N6)-dimethylallyltransferase MiaA [Clostridiaceae bacterium]|jgi:tRNA dimethylallyltransferase|nr:tRNA (adenosine(37)-N6)-dimethylallyltransferase MiaA [Bacillota bacterium]NLN51341.1 tRNA (adenosine(37)-N6)-dimethylallyltransferase MiaA [Clostridiaceae bacterium]